MHSQKKDNTENSQRKRVQLDHLLIDVDFFDKPKTKALAFKFDQLAVLWLVRVYACLSRATNGVASRDALRGIAYELRLEARADEMIEYCLVEGMLHLEGDNITSLRVIDDQESLADSREKWRLKNERAKGTSKINPRVTPEYTPDGPKRVTQIPVNTELLNTEDLNLDLERMDTPFEVDTPEHRSAVQRWVSYLRTKNKSLGDIEISQLLFNWAKTPDLLIPAIEFSIENGYRKLILKPPKDENHNGRMLVTKETKGERNIRILQEDLGVNYDKGSGSKTIIGNSGGIQKFPGQQRGS